MKKMIFLLGVTFAGATASAQVVSTGPVGGAVGATVGSTVTAPGSRLDSNVDVQTRATTSTSVRVPDTNVNGSTRVRATARVAAPSSWNRGDAAWDEHMRRCHDRYGSYDPATDSYVDRDGVRRSCSY